MKLDPAAPPLEIPPAFQQLDPLAYAQFSHTFELLDDANREASFHPAKIYVITLTALLYHDFEFEPMRVLTTNFGRDTVAAIASAILGAYCGAHNLPA